MCSLLEKVTDQEQLIFDTISITLVSKIVSFDFVIVQSLSFQLPIPQPYFSAVPFHFLARFPFNSTQEDILEVDLCFFSYYLKSNKLATAVTR